MRLNTRWQALEDLTGKKFGKLTVIGPAPQSGYRGRKYFTRCDCGFEKETRAVNLLSGASKSCGQASCRSGGVGSNHVGWKGSGEISGYTWGAIRNNAKQRGIVFTITIDYAWKLFVLQDGKCALSGLPLHFNTLRQRDPNAVTTASLDRIDSTKGYVEGNVQWLHKNVNFMKHSLSQEVFIYLCHKVATYAKETKVGT